MKANSLEVTLEKVSRVITDRYGLRLVCEGDRCRTDGRTIYLPSLPDNVPEQLLGAIRGWADHECAHAIYTQTRLGPEFQKEHGTEAFSILNALEDARVERLMGRRYPGARLNLEEGFGFVGARAEKGQLRARSPFDQFTAALYTRASHRRDQRWISRQGYQLVDLCEEELSELSSCRRTRDVAQVALKIWEKLRAAFEGEADAGPDVDSDTDSGQDGGSGRETESESSDQESEGQSCSGGTDASQEDTAEGFNPMELLGSLIQHDLNDLYSGQEGQYRVYTTEHDVIEVPEVKRGFDYRREMDALRPYVSALRRKLLQTLMGRKQTLWLGDRARGRLDSRSLHRLVTGRSGRVFRKRVKTEGKDTACTLLLDISSSMSGPSIDLCRKLALVFAETLEVLGFPTEVVGFSTLDDDVRARVAQETGVPEEELAKRYSRFVPLYHALFKTFDEPWKKVAGRIGAVQTRSLTPLGESLLFAGKRLAQRPESRKVLFCLTDGKPVV
ncbi:MAG: hypothetical protein KAX19_06060, partial [Candidatus Brocadiae bacterium]|nr:hypothetical protein [Candidatus Brocadiia bacterium]